MSDLILIKVLIEWIKCVITATPPPSATDTIMLAVRVSDAANRTLGFKTMRVPRVKGRSPGHRFKTNQWSTLDLWFDFHGIPAREPTRISVVIFNLGALQSDSVLEAVVAEIDRTGVNTFTRPGESSQAVVGHQVTGGAAIIAGTAVGGPAGAAIGLGVAGAIQGIKHLNKNHDGVIKYETMWVTPGDLATDQASRANWFKCASSSRLPGARALYEMTHRIVRC